MTTEQLTNKDGSYPMRASESLCSRRKLHWTEIVYHYLRKSLSPDRKGAYRNRAAERWVKESLQETTTCTIGKWTFQCSAHYYWSQFPACSISGNLKRKEYHLDTTS